MLTAIVVAAGKSQRMQGEGDKVLLPVADHPVLYYSLYRLQQCQEVSAIVLVTRAELTDKLWHMFHVDYQLGKLVAVVPGGQTRQDSVAAGLQYVQESDWVLVHDGARPCLATDDLVRVIQDAREHGASILGVPVTDTIKVVDSGFISSTPDRETLWAAQTPQVFKTSLLRAALQLAGRRERQATDDAALVAELGCKVHITRGSRSNIKITTPEDVLLAEQFIRREHGKCQ